MKKMISFILILAAASLIYTQENSSLNNLLSKPLKRGEAIIWYLFHSGWAVKTQSHFLIFDYWEEGKKPSHPSLMNGFINPGEIDTLSVVVFVSHSHSDHYDPIISTWKESISTIKYIWGWPKGADSTNICFDRDRRVLKTDDLEIVNIHHEFDRIPESAFMVTVDGLTLYHAGDHGHSQGENNKTFKDNIDYLANFGRKIDLVFTPTFGGEYYAIATLKPNVVFPMHDGGYEYQYKKFFDKVKNNTQCFSPSFEDSNQPLIDKCKLQL